MDEIVSIVTRLPPTIDGVGDYSLKLAQALRDEYGVETSFVVCDPFWPGPENVEGFRVVRVAKRDAGALLELLPRSERATLLLHYGGYGYAKRGCPFWLAEALRRWRKSEGARTLLTMFHELYARGPLWSSSFWLSPLQRNLAARLARLSDGCLTSLEAYARKLSAMRGIERTPPLSAPVFSSVGEPSAPPSNLARRRRCLVVFGTRGRRAEVYRRSADDLRRFCRALQIEEVLDIGKSLEGAAFPELGAPIVARGELPGEEVCEALADSFAGVIDYPAQMLGKSTIFAAYCTHRVLPLVATGGPAEESDGLRPGRDYLLVRGGVAPQSIEQYQKVADSAHEWYQSHTLSEHARTLQRFLRIEVGNFERGTGERCLKSGTAC